MGPMNPNNPTIGDMIGAYKSLVAVECLKIFNTNNINQMMGKLWQRNYYEHIIRDEQSFNTISNYIKNNPQNWQNDKFHI
jgi:REP element-mobilizing transposase RayT